MQIDLPNKELDPVWNAFKQGSRQAFESIYRDNIHALLNYGHKVTSNKAIIEDSVQDLFCELWQSRERIAQTTSVKFYLFKALRYKITRNLLSFESDNALDTAHVEQKFWTSSYEGELIAVETEAAKNEMLRAQITSLPKRQQEAINLRYYHNFSNEEVAAIMEINYQTACNLIYAALKKIKNGLNISTGSNLH